MKVATQLYSKREVIAIFLCKNIQKPRKVKVLTRVKIYKRGCLLDTTECQTEVYKMKLLLVHAIRENKVNIYEVYSKFAAISVVYGQIAGSS